MAVEELLDYSAMGNFTSCRSSGIPKGKIVLPDGSVRKIDEPISVGELMVEHPRHVVVELRSLSSASHDNVKKLPSPLHADQELDVNKAYVLLPRARGKPGATAAASLSGEEVKRILSAAGSVLRFSSSTRIVIGLAMKGKRVFADAGRRNGSDLEEDKPETAGSTLEWSMECLEERPEFLLTRQFSCKGWKPSLGTIEERSLERKVSHWLF